MDTCMKCVLLGKNIESLYNYIKNIEGLNIVDVNIYDDDIWKDTDVSFIVCEIVNEDDFGKFKSVLSGANKNTNVVFPIIISKNTIEKNSECISDCSYNRYSPRWSIYSFVVWI